MVIGNLFLIVLGLIWIIFAVVEDLKKREIANWLNFSLVIFALAYRLFYCLYGNEGFSFFYQGLVGFGVFFIIGNLFYYGKVFAGGDAKLMIALGAVLPFSESFLVNINSALIFLLFFLIAGALYGVVSGTVLAIKSRKKFVREFSREFKSNKIIFYSCLIIGIIMLILAFFQILFLYLGLLFFIAPYIYFSAKSIDESCMIKNTFTKNLTEGDWLYRDVKVGNLLIRAKWVGLSKREIELLKKKKRSVLIREGIPFSPVFLISYLGLIYALFFDIFYFL